MKFIAEVLFDTEDVRKEVELPEDLDTLGEMLIDEMVSVKSGKVQDTLMGYIVDVRKIDEE